MIYVMTRFPGCLRTPTSRRLRAHRAIHRVHIVALRGRGEMDTTFPAYGAGPGCIDGQGTKSAGDITAPRPDAYVGRWQDRATRRAAARRRGPIRRPSRSGHNTTRSAPS